MKKLLLALLALPCLTVSAQNGYTPVTATALKQGGVPIANGTVLITPVSSTDPTRAAAMAVFVSGGGYEQPASFQGTITAGAISSTLLVPDQCLSTPAVSGAAMNYRVDIVNKSVTPNVTSTFVIPAAAQALCGSGGFALDHYAPTQTATLSATYSYGPDSAKPAKVAPGSTYNATDTHTFYTGGADGILHAVSGGGGTSIALKTANASNPNQTTLNIIPGANVTATPDSQGGVTIAAPNAVAMDGSGNASVPGNLTSAARITGVEQVVHSNGQPTAVPMGVNPNQGTGAASVLDGNMLEVGTERTGGGSEQDGISTVFSFYGLGINAGNPWSVMHPHLSTMNKFRTGIGQPTGDFFFDMALGDGSLGYGYHIRHSGSEAGNDEGGNGYGAEIDQVSGFNGTVAGATAAGATTLLYTPQGFSSVDGGPGGTSLPGAGNYITVESAAQSFYAQSTATPGGSHPWTSWITLQSGPTMPPVSTGYGKVTAIDSIIATSVPSTRNVTVALTGGAFTVNGGPLCIGGHFNDTGTVVSVGTASGGSQTMQFTSSNILVTGDEIYQGGPCGMGMVLKRGRSSSETYATHQYQAYPVVGSPASGVLASSTSILGGQQGAEGFQKTDLVFAGGTATRAANGTVTLTIGNGNQGADVLTVPMNSQETVTISSASVPGLNTTLAHATGASPFTAVPGVVDSVNDLSSYSVTYTQSGASTTASASDVVVTISGRDGVDLVPMARIAAVAPPVAGNYPLTLRANTLPALTANTVVGIPDFWMDSDRAASFRLGDYSTRRRDAGNQGQFQHAVDILNDTGGTSITAQGPTDGHTSANIGVRLLGNHYNGIVMEGPTGAALYAGQQGTAWLVGCPPANVGGCANPKRSTYTHMAIDTNIGRHFWLANVVTGGYSWVPAGLQCCSAMMYVPPSALNPYNNTQTAANDYGSESLLFGIGINTRRVKFLCSGDPFHNDYCRGTYLTGLSGGAVSLDTTHDGDALGSIQLASLRFSGSITQGNCLTVVDGSGKVGNNPCPHPTAGNGIAVSAPDGAGGVSVALGTPTQVQAAIVNPSPTFAPDYFSPNRAGNKSATALNGGVALLNAYPNFLGVDLGVIGGVLAVRQYADDSSMMASCFTHAAVTPNVQSDFYTCPEQLTPTAKTFKVPVIAPQFIATGDKAIQPTTTCNGTLNIPFLAGTEAFYEITLTGNCTVTFTGLPAAGFVRSMRTVFLQTAGNSYTLTLPAQSSTMSWSGQSVPTAPTAGNRIAFHSSADSTVVMGND